MSGGTLSSPWMKCVRTAVRISSWLALGRGVVSSFVEREDPGLRISQIRGKINLAVLPLAGWAFCLSFSECGPPTSVSK